MGKQGRRTADARVRPGRANLIRIIGGQHRGRKLPFPDLPGLRPTADRVRETLFNWLQPLLPGATCLDLFAGSGALGLEAASRGAGEVVMLDRSPVVVEQIEQNIRLLQLTRARIELADALHWLQGPSRPFDLVFVDPPFAGDLAGRCCRSLQQYGWLAPAARIYLESDARQPGPETPAEWIAIREKKAGQVRYQLFSR